MTPMTPIRSLSEATGQGAVRTDQFRRLLGYVLLVEAAFGLWLLLSAIFGFGMTEVEAAGISPALTGAFVLWAVMFQLPGYLEPIRNRLPVIIGVIGRYGIAIVCLFLCLWLTALVIFGLALALNIVFNRAVRAVLMSRP
ncbi:hypothetical protein [Roseovarius sp. M141]|uniref:hypothetical protein n=1 Tax=Roseovarius sp. M141 TaxID=2583806 RepID=UPI0020CB7A6F|nr:hypothetical protein [Roseovarius sp. M141]MCQ0090826.1 hypothetical protein [Roseovarius sp. M141]